MVHEVQKVQYVASFFKNMHHVPRMVHDDLESWCIMGGFGFRVLNYRMSAKRDWTFTKTRWLNTGLFLPKFAHI